jgi:co-chaperonin GroES (HSP10)
MKKIRPKSDWVLFEAVTIVPASGIVLSDGAKTNTALAKSIVRAVGPKVKGVRKGDEIIILPHAKLMLNTALDYPENHFLTREEEICATAHK